MEIIKRRDAKAAGLKYYFTGKPCPKGHVSKRSVNDRCCVQCNLEKNSAYHKRTRYWEKRKDYFKDWYAQNWEHCRDRGTAYTKANWEKTLAYQQQYRAEREIWDVSFRLVRSIRNRMRSAIRAANGPKAGKTDKMFSCSPEELVAHIESKFVDGMSWEDRSKWHIDHIIPCALFDLTDPEQQRQCFHYTNLQPLWIHEHREKTRKDGSRDWGKRKAAKTTA